MIFDSQDQKDFFFKVLRSYVCPYGDSLIISEKYAPSIQSAVVVSVEDQQELLGPVIGKVSLGETEMTPPQPKKLKDPAKVNE